MPHYFEMSPMTLRLLVLAIAASCASIANAENLNEVYALARASDPQLQAAEAAARAADEGIIQARSALLPQVSASGGYTSGNSSGSRLEFDRDTSSFVSVASTANSTSKTFGVDLNQTIYDHSNYTRLRASRASAARVRAQFQSAQQALMIRVAEGYFGVLTAADSVTSTKAQEKAIGRQLEQAQQRFNVGLSAITDVHEAQARFDSARASTILAQNALDDAREVVAELTGKNIVDVDSLVDDIEMKRPEPEDPSLWVDSAMTQSFDLMAAQRSVDAAEAGIEGAKAGHFPTLSAFSRYNKTIDGGTITATNTQGASVKSPSDRENKGNTLGLNLSIPIFSGFATSSKVRQAVADRDAAQDQFEVQRRAITRQTRNAFRAVLAGISEVEARKQGQISAQSALEATQAGFEVGTRTIVDVLLSQQVLFQAQRDYSQARHNYVLNGLRLKRAAGTLNETDLQAVNAQLKHSGG
jgi:outer membrane protein